jgi:molecular chaperone DnaK (HSP70)
MDGESVAAIIRKITVDPENLLRVLRIQPGATKKNIDEALIHLYVAHPPRENPQLAQVVTQACRKLEKTGRIKSAVHDVKDTKLILGLDVGSYAIGCGMWLGQSVKFLSSPLGGDSGKSLLSYYASISGESIVGPRAESIHGSITVSNIIDKIQAASRGRYPRNKVLDALTSLFQTVKASEAYSSTSNLTVATVPAAFSRLELALVYEAATRAGVNISAFLSCSRAAAIAYSRTNSRKNIEKVLIFDLGASKLEIGIVDYRTDDATIIQMLAVCCRIGIGINAIDEEIVRFMIKEFERKNRPSLRLDDYALRRLNDAAKRIRTDIAYTGSAQVDLRCLASDSIGTVDFELSLDAEKYNAIISSVLGKANEMIRQTLQEAQLTSADISTVLLVGGGSRLPTVKSMLQSDFPTSKISQTVDPIETPGQGACIRAATICGLDKSNTLLLDITWQSLGVGTKEDHFVKIILKNTIVPTRRSATFTTVRNNQGIAVVTVYEGEDNTTSSNAFLGELMISGLIPKLSGLVTVEVTFDIDALGTLQVSAKELDSNKKVSTVFDLRKIGQVSRFPSPEARMYAITANVREPIKSSPPHTPLTTTKAQPRTIGRVIAPKERENARWKKHLQKMIRKDRPVIPTQNYCVKCGKPVRRDFKYCRYCGAIVTDH